MTYSDWQKSLETARETESDLLLVQMVRTQRVIESIHTTDNPNAPARLYVKAYQADIERLKRANPFPDENVFLRMQYSIADLHMTELTLADLAESKGASLSGRLEDLHNCVEALKALCKTTPSCQFAVALNATEKTDESIVSRSRQSI